MVSGRRHILSALDVVERKCVGGETYVNDTVRTGGLHFFWGGVSVALRPKAGHGLLILEVSRSHTTTHHSR